jgi:2-hydroxychromene-2-carboxylate isomerase
MKNVEFLFDVGSLNSYLAWTQLPGLSARTGAGIVWTPILLGAVFKATGNVSPAAVPAKGAYLLKDTARFARRYGVPLKFNPHFPLNTLALMRGAVAAEETGILAEYLDTVFPAIWAEELNMGNAEVAAERLGRSGIGPALFERARSDEIKARLRANTDGAVARGVFGAPTFFVGDEMFFGQDRMDFVEQALSA